MMTFSLWKQLKRRLRRNRRPFLTLGGVSSLLIAGVGATTFLMSDIAFANGIIPKHHIVQPTESHIVQPTESHIAQPFISHFMLNNEVAMPVLLRRVYVCGEERETLGKMEEKEIIQLLRIHPGWSASLDQDGKSVVIVQRIDDMSDYCKTHAYFGVDKNGNFSLFDGIPKEEKVMRTFFQLDIRYMESSLPQDKINHLNQGIRVNDIDEFNSVLSTFSDYAMDRNEKAMKQAY